MVNVVEEAANVSARLKAKNVVTGAIDGLSGKVGNAASKVTNVVGKGAKAVGGTAVGVVQGFFSRPGFAIKSVGVLAGVAAVAGIIALVTRGGRKKEHLAPADLATQIAPSMEMPMGPADGRAPGEWQARMRANSVGAQQRGA
jgi:hypothetical protein